MRFQRSRKKSRSQPAQFLQKPVGVIHPRVQKVGPEHFGIIAIDCAKARSKWMLTDFYGKILVPPTEVEHNRVELEAAVAQARAAMTQHGLTDGLVAVERTGSYHHVVKNAFAKGGFETRIVHPFATKQFRQPANPDNKTDDTDLVGSAAALLEQGLPGLGQFLRDQQVRFQQRTLDNVLRWARSAAAPDLAADFHRRIALAYEDDYRRKPRKFSRRNATSRTG